MCGLIFGLVFECIPNFEYLYMVIKPEAQLRTNRFQCRNQNDAMGTQLLISRPYLRYLLVPEARLRASILHQLRGIYYSCLLLSKCPR